MSTVTPLKDNTVYRDGRGTEVRVVGPTKNFPEYVWSIAGNWYVRATGQRLTYRVLCNEHGQDVGGEHVPMPVDCYGTLTVEVGPYV